MHEIEREVINLIHVGLKEISCTTCAGQRRKIIVKQAARVSKRTLQAKIADIEEWISDEEREYERKSTELADTRKNKEGGTKEAVVEKTVARGGSQLGDLLFDKMKSLAKVQEAARTTLSTKGKQLETSVESIDEHGTPTTTDTVDLGEQDAVDDVTAGDCPDLDYLWVVDTRTLQPPPASEDTVTKDNREDAASKRHGAFATDVRSEANSKLSDEAHEEAEQRDRKIAVEKVASGPIGRLSSGAATDNADGLATEVDDVKNKVNGHPADAFEKQFETDGSSNSTVCEQGSSGDSVAGSKEFLNEQPLEESEQSTNAPDERVKQHRGTLVPGNLILKSVSVSDLSGKGEYISSEQDLYLVAKWAEQEARTTVKRSSSNNCSWPGEEIVLVVRSKEQLQESVQVELWDSNVGHKNPRPDTLIGRDTFSVKHLVKSAAGPVNVDASRGTNAGPTHGFDEGTDEEVRFTDMVINATLEPGEEQWQGHQHIKKGAGVVMVTLTYTPPSTEKEACSNSGTDEDPMKSLAGGKNTSNPDKQNKMSLQELEAFTSQQLEGFDIREELTKIECQQYAEGLIREAFGQRGAFAHVQEEHLAGHPIYMPRGARKRVMALAKFTRLHMKAESEEDMTALETIVEERKAMGERYTVDGKTCFDTMAKLRASLREGGCDEARASVGEEDNCFKLNPRKPPTAAKEKIIRAIEAAAAAEERGIFKPYPLPKPSGGRGVDVDGLSDGRRVTCCEKHSSMIQKTTMKRVEERVQETVEKANTWLQQADSFKNGELSFDAARVVMRDTLVFSGLPSPRESDVRIHLERVSRDSRGPQLNRWKLGQELEAMVRQALCSRYDVSYSTPLD